MYKDAIILSIFKIKILLDTKLLYNNCRESIVGIINDVTM